MSPAVRTPFENAMKFIQYLNIPSRNRPEGNIVGIWEKILWKSLRGTGLILGGVASSSPIGSGLSGLSSLGGVATSSPIGSGLCLVGVARYPIGSGLSKGVASSPIGSDVRRDAYIASV